MLDSRPMTLLSTSAGTPPASIRSGPKVVLKRPFLESLSAWKPSLVPKLSPDVHVMSSPMTT